MSLLVLFGKTVTAAAIVVLGSWLHESTHAFAVAVLGGEVHRCDLWELEVEYTVKNKLHDRIVKAAPGVIGALLAPVLWILWDGSIGAIWVGIWIAWFFYAVGGGSKGELRLPGATKT